tara:strand:- start:1204 stop:1512 length:309 start_codon:yes stop_codon:yes gene_type:complete
MAYPKFKQKCKICKAVWTVVNRREFPICVECHMKQIFSGGFENNKVTDKKYKFLNVSKELYERSRFLRNIRQSYFRYEELTENQINAFKKTVKELKENPDDE